MFLLTHLYKNTIRSAGRQNVAILLGDWLICCRWIVT